MGTLLGAPATYPTTYSPEVLEFIPRAQARSSLFRNAALPFDGVDIWNSYELSWLSEHGAPESAVLRFECSASSSHIVESKSLKIYLGSLSFTRFNTKQALIETISKDLIKGLGVSSIQANLFEPDSELLNVSSIKGYCVDIHKTKKPSFSYDPTLLRIGSETRDEILYTHSFRSLCPVTSQPDWATVAILYRGKEIIPESFMSYITSLRSHQGFHESCCELMFHDINTKCSPDELSVMCAFTRRGGIDINPIRTTKGAMGLQYRRLHRQ